MKLRTLVVSLAILTLTAGAAYAAVRFSVRASEFDPAHTFLVQAQWLDGIGCPTNANVSADGTTTTSHYTDLACATGDSSDSHNQGLLLAKTGPTANFASAGADITGVKGITLTELGYDIRKPGALTRADDRGSHCGAGAPRSNVTASDGVTYDFIGCHSGAAPPHFFRLREVAAFFLADGFFLASGEIKKAASGLSLTSGLSSAISFGVTFFTIVQSASGVSPASASSVSQGTSSFFFWAALSSRAAFRVASRRARSIFTSLGSSSTCFLG